MKQTRYAFALTDAEGNEKQSVIFDHFEIRGALIYQYHFSEGQVDYALAVLHTTAPGNVFELSEFGETDNQQIYMRSGRLKIVQGSK